MPSRRGQGWELLGEAPERLGQGLAVGGEGQRLSGSQARPGSCPGSSSPAVSGAQLEWVSGQKEALASTGCIRETLDSGAVSLEVGHRAGTLGVGVHLKVRLTTAWPEYPLYMRASVDRG